jgi:hypothetical protein
MAAGSIQFATDFSMAHDNNSLEESKSNRLNRRRKINISKPLIRDLHHHYQQMMTVWTTPYPLHPIQRLQHC